MNPEFFLGILSLELGIKLGDIWDFQVLPTDFFLWNNLKASWENQVIDEGYFCYEMLNIGFFLQKLLLLL